MKKNNIFTRLESRYLPALFSAKFLKHVPQLFC
nr:MAG TPA: hypothetical protein [Caudoviricetes sp.]